MVEAGDLVGQVHRYLEALELRAEGRAARVANVAVDGARRGHLDMVHLGADVGDVLLEAGEGFLGDARLVRRIVGVGQRGPGIPELVDGRDDGVARHLGVRARVGVVNRVGPGGRVEVGELGRAERLGLGGEDEVADVRDGLALAHAEVDLAGGAVEADGLGGGHEGRVEVLLADGPEGGVLDVGVGEHDRAGDLRLATEAGVAQADAGDAAAAGGPALGHDLLDEDVAADVDAVGLHLGRHQVDEGVGAALEDEDALRHEVREDDAEGDGGVVERGAVGVGDGLEEEALHVGPAREELLEELARGARVVVVVVHRAQVREEVLDDLGGHAELLDEDAREVGAVEGGVDLEVGVEEADVLELVDAVRDLLGPVAAGGLDHPVREAVQGDVKGVPALALEIGGEAAELVVVLAEQDLPAELGQVVGGRHPAEAGADDHGVVAGLEVVERGHGEEAGARG